MKTIRQMCDNCAGIGRAVNWRITNLAEGNYGTAEKVEEECCACGGKGYTEYAVFTVEETQAILKHCGIITEDFTISLSHNEDCAQFKSADAVGVPHGEWITKGDYLKNTTCSLCNYWVETPYGKTAYCPNCGAKMDGKGEGE